VTTDAVIFRSVDDDLQVLLVKRKFPPFAGAWAFPGGFVNIDESLEDAVCRELEEETGLRDIVLKQFYTFGGVDRDPRGRVITVAYLGLVGAHLPVPRAGDDAADARWWPTRDLPQLAFDHAKILNCGLKQLQRELQL